MQIERVETVIVECGTLGSTAPLLVAELPARGLRRVMGKTGGRPVDWGETFADLVARIIVGLAIGAALCLLAVPLLYWPSKHDRYRGGVSTYERRMERLAPVRKWVFLTLLVAPPVVYALRTRVSWRVTEGAES
jgi:hypothetical protein